MTRRERVALGSMIAVFLLFALIGLAACVQPTPTPTVEPPVATATPYPDLNQLNKIACPGFLCEPDANGWSEGWTVASHTTDTPETRYEFNPQHILGMDQGQWAAGQIAMNSFEYPANVTVYQRFNDLQAGAMYVGNGWAFAYAGRAGVTGQPSEGWITLQVGIDPFGGLDPNSESIIWGVPNANMLSALNEVFIFGQGSDIYAPTDVYDPYTWMFTAVGPDATLYIRINSDFAYEVMTVTLDQFEMRAVGWADQFGY